tara:strand:- start:2132 stop:3130 length:999 start_codon:yes stop_codon:yes gene_type:complete
MLSPVSAEVPGLTVVAPPDGMGKLAQLRFMARAMRGQTPDVFYAHYASEYVCWLAGLMRRGPFAIHAMGSDVLLDALGRNGALRAWLTRHALRRADLLTVKSPFITEALVSLGIPSARIHEVIWGVDPQQVRRDETARRAWRDKWHADDDTFVVLSPRPLDSLYRQSLLIEAMPDLIARHGNIRAVISEYNANEGYRNDLRDQAAALGIADHVRFLPAQSAEDMAGLLSAADTVVSLAYTDGTPQTVLEAQACGVPVVIADIPDIRHVFTHNQDCLMTAAEPMAIAEALIAVASNRALCDQLVAGGVALIRDRANFPNEVTRVETLLRSICK